MSKNLGYSKQVISAAVGLVALTGVPAMAAVTGWAVDAGGDYNTPGNWEGGAINGVWDPSLTITADRAITFAGATSLAGGLSFGYGGNGNLTLRASGSGAQTLTLAGDISVSTATNRTITIGSTTPSQNLLLNLGNGARTFDVLSSRVLSVINNVSNGGLVVSGGGAVYLGGTSNSFGTLSVRGSELRLNGSNNTGANTVNTVTNGLGVGGATTSGHALVTLTTAATRHSLLEANTFTRTAGNTVLFRGTNLGVNSIASATVGSSNIKFTVAPNLSGGTGANTTDLGIIAGAYGDTASAGSGNTATGGLVTYDAAKGVRLLSAATEYTSTLTDGQGNEPVPVLHNLRLVNTSAAVATTTLNAANTTVNSLSVATSTAGSGTTIAGAGTLRLNSGVIYLSQSVAQASLSANDATRITVSKLDLNGKEGQITAFTTYSGGGSNTSPGLLQITSEITNGTGLTITGSGHVQIAGATANTYTGPTTINGARVSLTKSVSNIAIPGDLVINLGAVYNGTNQIPDTSDVTINGGVLFFNQTANSGSATSDTFRNLTMTGGTISPGSANGNTINLLGSLNLSGGSLPIAAAGKLNVAGATNISGGQLRIARSTNTSNVTNAITTLSGGLTITNTSAGSFTPITLAAGNAANTNGGELALGGNLTFVGNSTNANPTVIDAPADLGPRGVISLPTTRTFNIGDGAARTDLQIVAPIVGQAGAGLVKSGLGTLELSGAGTYSGATTVAAGVLLVNGSVASNVSVTGGTLAGSGTVGAVSVASGGTIAPGNSPGILNTGNVSFASGSTFAVELDGASLSPTVGYDQLNVTGTVALGGATLSPTLGYAPAEGDKLFIINNDGTPDDAISGTFAGLPTSGSLISLNFNSTTYLFMISYVGDFTSQSLTGGNDVVLTTVVPEPTMLGVLGLAAAGLVRRRRVG